MTGRLFRVLAAPFREVGNAYDFSFADMQIRKNFLAISRNKSRLACLSPMAGGIEGQRADVKPVSYLVERYSQVAERPTTLDATQAGYSQEAASRQDYIRFSTLTRG